ncbi:magnesium transporter [Hoyosella rhizosphaerae]|uniref:Magnesium transporter MgtE n=1 Tax=Hoyosella rhizosphaerae TaxID=1755582 RepID=A0A916U8F0_9ACTN|nr:magnesium transporter [Hoyosella rhizosphaerae]MBN4927431.1 magnesium transporter [Hoyosella rhizosphaerae]GGC64464.1 magnesium transporter MgtE [Hoyosella rhizosphaerae]
MITEDLDTAITGWPDRLREGDLAAVGREAADMALPDLVWVLERLRVRDRAIVFRLLPKGLAHEVFERFDEGLRAELFTSLRDDQVVMLFGDLDPDDRVHLMDELPASVAKKLLQGLSKHERELTAPILGYERGSIGRRMSTEYVRVLDSQTVLEALTQVRHRGRDAETIYTVPVTDSAKALVGVVSLRDLMLADTGKPVGQIMNEAISVYASEDAEDAARRCLDSQVLALPVVDKEERLVGILTVDDAVRIIRQAEEEDAARAGAVEPLGRPYLSTPVRSLVRSRVVWLLLLAVSAVATVGVLDHFEDDLATVVTLAVFIPLIIGTGGNTGSQAAVTITRAVALGDVRPRDVGIVLLREIRTGAALGALLGALALAAISTVAFFFDGYTAELGVVVAASMLAICTLAASVGGVIPLFAKAVKIDPAVMSTPFIATFVDATGLIIYFLIAKVVLGI